jgi:hypothetical protein
MVATIAAEEKKKNRVLAVELPSSWNTQKEITMVGAF